jgi:protease-4
MDCSDVRNAGGVTRTRALPRIATLAGLLLLVGGCAPMSFLVTPVPASRALVEFEVRRDSLWASKKIALIDVEGAITNAPAQSMLGVQSDNPVAVFTEKLQRAAADHDVRAVVLRINSPGGGVTASELMYDELRRFREKTGKPVIASMLDVAASGGYYIACACDRVFALPTTVTGSIGVIMIVPDISGTMAKIGLRTNVIKSGTMKDVGSPFRAMSPADRDVFQGMIDQMYEQFVAVVVKARGDLSEARVRALADGRVYLGPVAKENGLVDEIGTLYDALGAARAEAGLADDPIIVVQYARPAAHKPNIHAAAPGGQPQVNMINVELPRWLASPSPQFLYMWAPGW